MKTLENAVQSTDEHSHITPAGRLPALGSVSLKIFRIGIYNSRNKFLDSLSIDLGNKKNLFFGLHKAGHPLK